MGDWGGTTASYTLLYPRAQDACPVFPGNRDATNLPFLRTRLLGVCARCFCLSRSRCGAPTRNPPTEQATTTMRSFLFTALLAASSAALVDLHHATHIPAGWRATPERVSGDAVFHNVMVGLKRSNTAKLSQLVAEVSDPKGASYLNYPSYEALGDMVRPQAEHTAAVKAWVAEHGAAIVGEHPHGDYLTLRATAAQLEAMSNGEFTTYVHGATGMKVHRITNGVRVPDAVAEAVDTFSGFHGFPLEPKAPATPPRKVANCTVTPPVIRKTYGVTDVPRSGKQNIQAIAQFGQSMSQADLTLFCKNYDPTTKACTVDKYVGPNNQSHPGFESTLDTDYIVPLSRDTATWLYSTNGHDFCSQLTAFAATVTAESTYPFVISMSYGGQLVRMCTPEMSGRFAADVEKMAAMGITLMVSSGDSGSGHNTRGGLNPGVLNPAYPASVPHAIAVGSTYWLDGTSGVEQASTTFGSGGGFSYNFTAPSYQTAAIKEYLSAVTLPQYGYAKGGRGSPDVSMLGEDFAVGGSPGYVFCLSGTSASSPSFAALVTLLNEVCLAESGKPLGFANPLFYQNPGMFNDVTHGTNAVAGNTQGWAAIKGWDASTGLGTPNFPEMVKVVRKACSKQQ